MCQCSSNVAYLCFLALFCELRDSQCQACSGITWTEPQRQIILQIVAMNGNINSTKSFWWLVSNVLCVSDYVGEHYTHNFTISKKKNPILGMFTRKGLRIMVINVVNLRSLIVLCPSTFGYCSLSVYVSALQLTHISLQLEHSVQSSIHHRSHKPQT